MSRMNKRTETTGKLVTLRNGKKPPPFVNPVKDITRATTPASQFLFYLITCGYSPAADFKDRAKKGKGPAHPLLFVSGIS